MEQVAKYVRTDKVGPRNYCRQAAFVTASIFLCSGCSRDPAKLYQSSKHLFAAGDNLRAERQALEGHSLCKDRPQSEWCWKFTLLAAEIELVKGNTTEAEALLSHPPPGQFGALQPRYEMLRGYLLAPP